MAGGSDRSMAKLTTVSSLSVTSRVTVEPLEVNTRLVRMPSVTAEPG